MNRKIDNKDLQKLIGELNDNPILLKQIADASPAVIYLIDLGKKEFIYVNKRIEYLLGFDELYIFAHGKNIFFELCHPEDCEVWLQQIESLHVLNDTESSEIELRLKSRQGNYRWFRISDQIFKRSNNGEPAVAIGVIYDIHEEKLAQMELLVSKRRLEEKNAELQNFQHIIESSHDAIFALDLYNKVIQWNRAAVELFGYSEEEARGSSIIQKLMGNKKLRSYDQMINRVKRGEIIPGQSLQMFTVNGVKLEILLNMFPIRDDMCQVSGCCCIARNITKELQAEKDIRDLNKTLVLKNRELASLAEELRTFNSVATTYYMETLKTLYTCLEYIVTIDGSHLSNTGRANIRRAQASIQKMKLLTHDIIAYLKLQEFNKLMATVDLNEVTHKLISEFQEKYRDVKIEIRMDRLPYLKTNSYLIRLLLLNLLDNSIKFRKGTGPVIISIKYTQADELNFMPEAIKDTAYHIITVTDNGIGIENQYIHTIFRLFTRLEETKYRGSGVGLAVCKKIMDLHGGFINVDSELGQGSVFRCYFPEQIS